MEVQEGYKRCSSCKEVKPVDEFSRDRSRLADKIARYRLSPRVRGDHPANGFKFHEAVRDGDGAHLFYESTFWEGGEVGKAPYRYRQLCHTRAISTTTGIRLSNVGNTHFHEALCEHARRALGKPRSPSS